MQENEKDKRNRTVDKVHEKERNEDWPVHHQSYVLFPFPNKSRSYEYYALHEIKCLLMFI